MAGRIALAGLTESRLTVKAYLDIVWCLLPEVPNEALKQLTDDLLTAEARADPVYARENWGLLEEQRQRAVALESEDGGSAPTGDQQSPIDIDPRLAGGSVAPQGR